MKRNSYIWFMFIIIVILSGCLEKRDETQLYKQESPLLINLDLPESLDVNQLETFAFSLLQNGHPLKEVERLEVQIWNEIESIHYTIDEFDYKEEQFMFSQTFKEDGIYYLKINATNNGSTIFPTSQLIIGDLSKEEILLLQNREKRKENSNHDSHH